MFPGRVLTIERVWGSSTAFDFASCVLDGGVLVIVLPLPYLRRCDVQHHSSVSLNRAAPLSPHHDRRRRRHLRVGCHPGGCCTYTTKQVFNVNTVDLAAKCAASLGASKLVYIADGSHLEDTITGM